MDVFEGLINQGFILTAQGRPIRNVQNIKTASGTYVANQRGIAQLLACTTKRLQ